MQPEQYMPFATASNRNLAAKLRHSRKASGVQQKDLAKWLGVTDRNVRYWERGERTPSDQQVARWAELTGFPLAWFYRQAA